MGQDPEILNATVEKVRAQSLADIKRLEKELAALDRDIRRATSDVRKHAIDPGSTAQLAAAQDRLSLAERRRSEVWNELDAARGSLIGEEDVAKLLTAF